MMTIGLDWIGLDCASVYRSTLSVGMVMRSKHDGRWQMADGNGRRQTAGRPHAFRVVEQGTANSGAVIFRCSRCCLAGRVQKWDVNIVLECSIRQNRVRNRYLRTWCPHLLTSLVQGSLGVR